jgi:hypothetical protein
MPRGIAGSLRLAAARWLRRRPEPSAVAAGFRR